MQKLPSPSRTHIYVYQLTRWRSGQDPRRPPAVRGRGGFKPGSAFFLTLHSFAFTDVTATPSRTADPEEAYLGFPGSNPGLRIYCVGADLSKPLCCHFSQPQVCGVFLCVQAHAWWAGVATYSPLLLTFFVRCECGLLFWGPMTGWYSIPTTSVAGRIGPRASAPEVPGSIPGGFI